jgi:hypothetical protein
MILHRCDDQSQPRNTANTNSHMFFREADWAFAIALRQLFKKQRKGNHGKTSKCTLAAKVKPHTDPREFSCRERGRSAQAKKQKNSTPNI